MSLLRSRMSWIYIPKIILSAQNRKNLENPLRSQSVLSQNVFFGGCGALPFVLLRTLWSQKILSAQNRENLENPLRSQSFLSQNVFFGGCGALPFVLLLNLMIPENLKCPEPEKSRKSLKDRDHLLNQIFVFLARKTNWKVDRIFQNIWS